MAPLAKPAGALAQKYLTNYRCNALILTNVTYKSTNQVPSLCDFSRCVLSCSELVKQSEQCLHEYGFAPV